MAQRNVYSSKDEPEDTQSAEEVLHSVMQELDALHQNVKGQLNQDITRLQTEKNHLIEDIEDLREQYRKLQSQQMESLSGRYIQQQQLWTLLQQQIGTTIMTNFQNMNLPGKKRRKKPLTRLKVLIPKNCGTEFRSIAEIWIKTCHNFPTKNLLDI